MLLVHQIMSILLWSKIFSRAHMDENRFNLKFVSKLDTRFEKVNVPTGSSFIKWTDWLQYKNVRVNPQNIDDRCFKYAYALIQHYNEIINYRVRVSNIKAFIDEYNWKSIVYPANINKNNYILFDENISEIPLCCMLVQILSYAYINQTIVCI